MDFFKSAASVLAQIFSAQLAQEIERQFPPKSEALLAKKDAQRRLEGA